MSEQDKNPQAQPSSEEAPSAAGPTDANNDPQTSGAAETATASETAATAAHEAASPESLEADLDALRTKLAQTEDQLMRAVADVQNSRKRAERDRRDAETYGGTKLARDLLSVFDNLDAALAQASDALKANEPGFFNGVDLTRKELLNAFAKHQITIVSPEPGEKFDPNRHQAMYEAPTPGAETGTVIQVMQHGFMIADRLLRPAMVGVAKAAPASPAAAEASAGDA